MLVSGLGCSGFIFKIDSILIGHLVFDTYNLTLNPGLKLISLDVNISHARWTLVVGDGGPNIFQPINLLLSESKYIIVDNNTIGTRRRFDLNLIAKII